MTQNTKSFRAHMVIMRKDEKNKALRKQALGMLHYQAGKSIFALGQKYGKKYESGCLTFFERIRADSPENIAIGWEFTIRRKLGFWWVVYFKISTWYCQLRQWIKNNNPKVVLRAKK